MSAHRRRINRKTAEDLLSHASVASPGDPDPLVDLLARAAAPAHKGELAGEPTAMAAFRATHLGPALSSRRSSMIRSLARLFTVKVAAAALGTAAVGGVALAAGTGALPTPSGGSQAGVHAGSTAPASSSHPAPSHATNDPSVRPTAPSPSLAGLCRAYPTAVRSNPGKALKNPAFSRLIAAAGGKENVAGYCAALLGSHHPTPDPQATRGAERTHPHSSPHAHPPGRSDDR